MKKNVKHAKIVALFLALLLVLQITSTLPVFAAITDDAAISLTSENGIINEGVLDPKQAKINTLGDLTREELQTAVLAEEDIPASITIEDIKEKGHVNRLRQQETDLNTVIFQNKDGTKTMYLFEKPVKYIDKDGNVKDKSNKLSESKDKSISKYETTDNDTKVLFPNNITSGLVLQHEGINLTLTPLASKHIDILSNNANKELKKLVSDGEEKNRIVYNNVFDDKTALIYTPTLSGIKEDIILQEYTGQNSFSFILNTNGLTLCKDEMGIFCLADPISGEKKVSIGAVISYDYNGKTSLGEITAETLKADSEYILTIVVDKNFLTDENTAYPVNIDPSINFEIGWTGIIDAPVYSGIGCQSVNNHNNIYAWVGRYIENGSIDYGAGRFFTDFPGLYTNSNFTSNIANAYQILDAEFQIHQDTNTTGTSTIRAYRYTGPTAWSENTITCSSISWDSYDTNYLDYETYTGDTACYRNYNITDAVRLWKADSSTRKGIMFKNDDESNLNNVKMLTTREHPNTVTKLTITYTTATTTVNLNRFYSTYSPSKYADLQNRMNCYAYAMKIFYSGGFPIDIDDYLEPLYDSPYLQTPGEFKRDNQSFLDLQNDLQNSFTINNVYDKVVGDLNSFGCSAEVYTVPSNHIIEQSPANKRLVLLVLKNNSITDRDYHFYMQESDGKWSHKRGNSPVSNCAANNINPNDPYDESTPLTNYNIYANMTNAGYDDGFRFFYITKDAVLDYPHADGSDINCLYTPTLFLDKAGDNLQTSSFIGWFSTKTVNARFDYAQDVDYYYFVPSSSGTYTIKTTYSGTAIDIDGTLYNSSGNTLCYDNNSGNVNISVYLNANQIYYLEIINYNHTTADYTINITN